VQEDDITEQQKHCVYARLRFRRIFRDFYFYPQASLQIVLPKVVQEVGIARVGQETP
jgi:hypothetical protein